MDGRDRGINKRIFPVYTWKELDKQRKISGVRLGVEI